jgi:hypothetical protein
MNPPTTPSAANSLPERPSGKTNDTGSAASPCWALLPCDEPCHKCGSSDIHRMFHAKGDRVEHRFGGRSKSTKFVDRSHSCYGIAKRDCLAHHCRCCQYSWDTACLPNAKISGHAPTEDK